MSKMVFIFIVFSLVSGFSQDIVPEVISSAGGRYQSESISLHWTLGELSVIRDNDDGLSLSEGFHQHYRLDMATPVTDIKLQKPVFIQPNPCKSDMQIISRQSGQTDYRVYDSEGKYIMQGQFFGSTTIRVDQLEVGNYYIFLTTDQNTLGLYPFIKV